MVGGVAARDGRALASVIVIIIVSLFNLASTRLLGFIVSKFGQVGEVPQRPQVCVGGPGR